MTFNESYAGLSDVQLMEAGVTGAWSVRDILAHVTTWEEEALEHLLLILKGGTPPRYPVWYGGIDAFNACMMEQKRSLSLSEVREQLAATHGRLVDLVQSAPIINSSETPVSVIGYGSIPIATTRSTQREALRDGVFAIIITLLVLEIGRPNAAPGKLAQELLHEWPSYLAYALAFLYVGVIGSPDGTRAVSRCYMLRQ